jgi:hypothetical protein
MESRDRAAAAERAATGVADATEEDEKDDELEDDDWTGSDPSDARRIAYAERWIIEGMGRDPWAPPRRGRGAKQARSKRAGRRA